MKRFLTLALVGAVMLGAGSVAYANVCAFDPVPAATLLFPFVTYNYELGGDGYNTLFTITNVSYEATIAHVTVWTDYSRAILDFNVLLTGYDVQSMDIRSILRDGLLPVTRATTPAGGVYEDGPVSGANDIAAWDPPDLPSPQGTTSLSTRCPDTDPNSPSKYVTPISEYIRGLFEGWLKTSQTVPRYFENCDGVPFEFPGTPGPWFGERTEADNSFMYITVDVVETCNTLFPDQITYYDDIRYDNVLMGDLIFTESLNGYSEIFNAVQLEAFYQLPSTNTGFKPATFYHRYHYLDPTRFDWREPMPTSWAFRFVRDDGAGLTTKVRAWKGGMLDTVVPDLREFDGVNLDVPGISPANLVARNCIPYTYYVWDEQENVTTSSTDPFSYPSATQVVFNLLPLEAQEVDVSQFNTLGGAGWMLFVWPPSNFFPGGQAPDWYQTWMGVQYALEGQYSGAREGHVMANYNCFSDQVLPDLGYNDSNMPD